MVTAYDYVRIVDNVGLSSYNIKLTYDGVNYVIQWANNLAEYTPTGALLATAPLSGTSYPVFSIGGLSGPSDGQFALLTGSTVGLGEESLYSVSELSGGNPVSLDFYQGSVAASNAIGLSNGGFAAAWFNYDETLSLFADGFSDTITLGTGDGANSSALAQLSDGSIVAGWTDNEAGGIGPLIDDISLAIVNPLGDNHEHSSFWRNRHWR